MKNFLLIFISILLIGCASQKNHISSQEALIPHTNPEKKYIPPKEHKQKPEIIHEKVYAQARSNIRSGRGTSYTIIQTVNTNTVLYVDSLKSNWYAVYKSKKSEKPYGYIYSKLVNSKKHVSKVRKYVSYTKKRSKENTYPKSDIVLSARDNGYKWRKASYFAKYTLCSTFSKEFGRDPNFYIQLLNEFYNTDESYILEQEILDIVAMSTVY